MPAEERREGPDSPGPGLPRFFSLDAAGGSTVAGGMGGEPHRDQATHLRRAISFSAISVDARLPDPPPRAAAQEEKPAPRAAADTTMMSSPDKSAAVPPAGHQRVHLPSLTVALLLVSTPLLLWSVDTAVIRAHGGRSSFAGYLLPAVTVGSHAANAAAAASARSLSLLSRTNRAAEEPAAATQPPKGTSGWISTAPEPNFTATLLSRWRAPGGQPCREAATAGLSIPALDGAAGGVVELAAGPVHEFVFHAVDGAGSRRCLGGDFFETDLSSPMWKSRPPVTDHGNGSYTMRFQVHPDFAGNFNLTVVLLFRRFEGLKYSTRRFAVKKELRHIPIRFRPDTGGGGEAAVLPHLQVCRAGDFLSQPAWSGRWTRLAGNGSCEISRDGRYRCLDPELPCKTPWCGGALEALESNGWVYSAHCSFTLFRRDAAWRCLRGRWLFFWGDSNHVDSIRNLLNFVLGLTAVPAVPRRVDDTFVNPRNPNETVRITSIYNGHSNETMNYEGLYSLRDEGFRDLVRRYFSDEDQVPDTVVLNSGLHDGVYWRNLPAFTEGAEYAAQFWDAVLAGVRARGRPVPAVFYRTTVATGGYARELAFNPQKMEAFNGVLVEKLRGRGLLTGGVIDGFDMTFPWHWDNRCSDGVHYGRAPAKARWLDGQIGHQYFVDLMLVHVLLNAFCNAA